LSSLSEHLATIEGHARLRFRGDCPLCRAERLNGSVAPAPLVSRRAQAGLAAAVLMASSAGAPAVAVAQKEPDVEHEGQAPDAVVPGDVGGDQAIDPEFDPGGALSPDVGGQTDDGAVSDEGEAVEGDVVIDPVALEEQREDAIGPTTGDPSPNHDDRRGPAAQPDDPQGAPPVETPARQDRGAVSAPPAHLVEPGSRADNRNRSAEYWIVADRREPDPPSTAPSSAMPAAATPPVVVTPASADSAAAQPSRRATRHVVQPGETLWSIARELLGPRATVAAIAREVQRIWDLNADAIASGDPSLIVPGQVLVLR
jgi:LysM domain-containing protein